MGWSIMGLLSALLVALLPFIVLPDFFYSAVNSKYFLVIATVDILALIAAYKIYRKQHTLLWKNRWLALALLLVLATQYLSSYLGIFPEKSLWSDILRSTGVLFLTHVALFAFLIAEFLKKEDWTLLRRFVVVSCAVFSVFTILGAYGLGLIENKVLWINFGNDGLTIGNSTFAGAYLLLGFILGLIELVHSSGEKVWRRVGIVSLVLIALSPLLINVYTLFRGQSLVDVLANPTYVLGSARASSVTLFALLGFVTGRLLLTRYVRQLSSYLVPLLGGVLLTLMGVVVALLFIPGSVVQDTYIENATAARVLIWDAGLEAFSERPYVGWGPENFNDAYERHFNNSLYLDKNIGEVWFDRAHNGIVDSLVSVGVVGVLAIVIFSVVFLWSVYLAHKKGRAGKTEALFLAMFIPAHFLQLQTGFDTVASYTLVGVIVGYVLSLEREDHQDLSLPTHAAFARTTLAVLLAIAAATSLKFVLYDEYIRQAALVATFTASSSLEQRAYLQTSLAQSSDWESLRLSATSFIKGAIASAPQAEDKRAYVANVLGTAQLYEEEFRQYLAAHPDYYRARMNYSYLLLTEVAFGGDPSKLKEAKELIEGSYHLSEGNPLTYGLDALALLYSLRFDEARERVRAAIELNPDVAFSREVGAYVEEQIARYPKGNKLLLLQNL